MEKAKTWVIHSLQNNKVHQAIVKAKIKANNQIFINYQWLIQKAVSQLMLVTLKDIEMEQVERG